MERRVVIMIVLSVAALVGVIWMQASSYDEPTPPTPAEPAGEPTSDARADVKGDPAPPPRPSLKRSVTKEIRLEGETTRFMERAYDPPYVLPTVDAKPSSAWHSTPEATLASYSSAMERGDFDWWLSMWDADGQAVISAHMAETERDVSVYLDGWRAHYAGRRQVLTRRIDLPGYVIAYMRRDGVPDDKPEAMAPLSIKQDADGRWWLTHDLKEHAVYFYDSLRSDATVRIVER